MAQIAKGERRPKPSLQQPGHNDRLSNIAKSLEHRGCKAAIAQHVCSDGADHHSDCKRNECTSAERNQDTGTDTGGRPEHRDIAGWNQQRKPEPRCQKIGCTDDHRPADYGRPPLITGSGCKVSTLAIKCAGDLQGPPGITWKGTIRGRKRSAAVDFVCLDATHAARICKAASMITYDVIFAPAVALILPRMPAPATTNLSSPNKFVPSANVIPTSLSPKKGGALACARLPSPLTAQTLWGPSERNTGGGR